MIHVTYDHDYGYDDGGNNEDLGDDDADQLLEFTLHRTW